MSANSNRMRSIAALSIACLAMGGPLIGMTLVGYSAPTYLHHVKNITIPLLSLWLVLLGGSATGLALLPSFFLGAVCGYLLPEGWSYLASVAGLAWATVVGLYVGSFFSTNFLEVLLQQKKIWWTTYQRLVNTAGSFLPSAVALLRLSPHMPFALTNLVCARLPMTSAKIWLFSYVGLLPRTILAAYVGGRLQDWRVLLERERPLWELLFSLVLLVILTYFIRRTARRFGHGNTSR